MEFKPWRIAASRRKNEPVKGPAELPELLRAVLKGRGLKDEEEARAFLTAECRLHDPMLLPDMDKAVERVRKAVMEQEKLLIYGDYDCDGVTASVILYDYLDNAGADVLYYIPEREGEGYGLNRAAVDRMKEAGVSLIVTVDNGVTALEEIDYAAARGIDVVVTDHHRPGETLPNAVAVVDPHRSDSGYPFAGLCGAGVAFKLICALEEDAEGMLLEHYGDLLAIATVADVVPLLDENRAMVQAGLSLLRETENPGIRALAEKAGIDLEEIIAERIAYGIAPRLNVAGRIGSVDLAVELLLCQEEERARELAGEICALNDRRKQMEQEVVREIQQQLEADPALLDRRVLVLWGEGWHRGIIGIIAARLVERYGKPCILLSVMDGEARGSARSVEGFSIIEAIRSAEPLLKKCGGHPMAAGLTLSAGNLAAFSQEMEDHARREHPVMPVLTVGVDTQLMAGEATLENARLLERLEPFGCQNPQPVFALLGVRVNNITPMGKEKNHLRFTIEQRGVVLPAVLFRVSPQAFPIGAGELADCAVNLTVDRFGGGERVKLQVVSIRPHGFDMAGKLRLGAAYQSLRRGEAPQDCQREELAFDREDLGVVFRWLREHSPYQRGADALAHQLGAASNYGKVLAALDILAELGLISRKNENGVESIRLLPAAQKAEITASPTYRLLQQGW